MHPRVNPSDDCLQETLNYTQDAPKTPSYISNHSTGEAWIKTTPDCCRSKEEMLTECERIYGPILKIMKLFGLYFGESSLKTMSNGASVRKKRLSFSFLYCLVIATSLWLNFAMASTSLYMGGVSFSVKFFVQLTNCFWSLGKALSANICLVVLPITETKTSRFEAFVRSLVDSETDLREVKSSATKILIFTALAWITSLFSVVIMFLFSPSVFVSNRKPWNEWYGFKVVNLILPTIFVAGAWLLPVAFLCITCLVLERLFDEFCKRAVPTDLNSLDLGALKEEHCKLCDIVEFASKMLSPLLFVDLAFIIPLLCFQFYAAVNGFQITGAEMNGVAFLLGALYWLMVSAATVAVILVFGSRVNSKIQSIQTILERAKIRDADQVKLLLFFFYLNGETKGLSIGGLVVITKSLCLTVVGIVVSYFAVMLSLPK